MAIPNLMVMLQPCLPEIDGLRAHRQVRPYPIRSGGTWQSTIFLEQCFFGFDQLQTEYEGQKSVFGGELGGWLPDPAINACKDWLNAHHKFLEASATHR